MSFLLAQSDMWISQRVCLKPQADLPGPIADVGKRKSTQIKGGVEAVPADWDLTYQAAHLKVRGNISFADCFAVALAKLKKADVVTGDKEFKQVEGEARVFWI